MFRYSLPRLLVVLAIATPNFAISQPADCVQEKIIQTGARISESLANQLNEFPAQYLNAPLLGAIHDFNGNGTRDFLSAEGTQLNTFVIRDGQTGSIIWGPFSTGANSIPNQLASIGDSNNDGVPEFAIGVRRTNNTNVDGVWVFNGASGNLIDSFPSNLQGRIPKPDHLPPQGDTRTYVKNPNVSGMTAAVAMTPVGKKIIYADANAYSGMTLYLHMCRIMVGIFWLEKPCYVEARFENDEPGMLNRDFGGQMVSLRNLNNQSVDPQLFIADPSMNFAVHVPPGGTPPNLQFSGGVYQYFSSENVSLTNLLPRTGGIRMGYAMSAIGDLDGDGWEELAVSSPSDMNENLVGGVVDIYRGGQSANPVYKHLSNGISSSGIQFGFSVSGPFDMNEDGVKDVLVGAPNYMGSGRVFVFGANPSDTKSKFIVQNPAGGSRFGHSVVALSPRRFAVADGEGQLQFINLGADLTGPEYKPNGIPDRCEDIPPTPAPTPTPSTPSPSQAAIDDVYLRLVSTSNQLELVRLNKRSSRTVTNLIKGMKSKTKKNESVVKGKQAIFLGVSPKLTHQNFKKMQTLIDDVQKAYTLNKPRNIQRANSRFRSRLSEYIGLLEGSVTQSIRVPLI